MRASASPVLQRPADRVNTVNSEHLTARIQALEGELVQVKKHVEEDGVFHTEELEDAKQKIEGLSEDVVITLLLITVFLLPLSLSVAVY